MIEQRNYNKNYFGTAIFIALFFLILCVFSKDSDISTGRVSQYELAYELHTNVTVLSNIQQFSFQKSVFPIIDKANFNLFSDDIKINTENRLINKQFIFLQKNQLLFKPILLLRFYNQFYHIDTEDLPILS